MSDSDSPAAKSKVSALQLRSQAKPICPQILVTWFPHMNLQDSGSKLQSNPASLASNSTQLIICMIL